MLAAVAGAARRALVRRECAQCALFCAGSAAAAVLLADFAFSVRWPARAARAASVLPALQPCFEVGGSAAVHCATLLVLQRALVALAVAHVAALAPQQPAALAAVLAAAALVLLLLAPAWHSAAAVGAALCVASWLFDVLQLLAALWIARMLAAAATTWGPSKWTAACCWAAVAALYVVAAGAAATTAACFASAANAPFLAVTALTVAVAGASFGLWRAPAAAAVLAAFSFVRLLGVVISEPTTWVDRCDARRGSGETASPLLQVSAVAECVLIVATVVVATCICCTVDHHPPKANNLDQRLRRVRSWCTRALLGVALAVAALHAARVLGHYRAVVVERPEIADDIATVAWTWTWTWSGHASYVGGGSLRVTGAGAWDLAARLAVWWAGLLGVAAVSVCRRAALVLTRHLLALKPARDAPVAL
eukprot:TRINITY_DN74_c0_g3_i1.p1 TRINITY_DN74_c0_g3~~TRINITY_DN74_c0_g3_i1.p1  ORF type:complete len:423 (-),score=117.79 TRINITY_DN74_c0_g3_i1:642-1910(-)